MSPVVIKKNDSSASSTEGSGSSQVNINLSPEANIHHLGVALINNRFLIGKFNIIQHDLVRTKNFKSPAMDLINDFKGSYVIGKNHKYVGKNEGRKRLQELTNNARERIDELISKINLDNTCIMGLNNRRFNNDLVASEWGKDARCIRAIFASCDENDYNVINNPELYPENYITMINNKAEELIPEMFKDCDLIGNSILDLYFNDNDLKVKCMDHVQLGFFVWAIYCIVMDRIKHFCPIADIHLKGNKILRKNTIELGEWDKAVKAIDAFITEFASVCSQLHPLLQEVKEEKKIIDRVSDTTNEEITPKQIVRRNISNIREKNPVIESVTVDVPTTTPAYVGALLKSSPVLPEKKKQKKKGKKTSSVAVHPNPVVVTENISAPVIIGDMVNVTIVCLNNNGGYDFHNEGLMDSNDVDKMRTGGMVAYRWVKTNDEGSVPIEQEVLIGNAETKNKLMEEKLLKTRMIVGESGIVPTGKMYLSI